MKIVFTPDWFIGKDVLIEAFSFLVLILFCVLAIKYYQMVKDRKFLYLIYGFGLIAVANLASIFTKLVLYYDFGLSREIGEILVSTYAIHSVDIFYYMGFFVQKLFTLLGLYTIYRLPRESKSRGDYLLIVYFIIISALVSENFYYIFHITALVLIVMIVENYYGIYQRNKFKNTFILTASFTLLGLSQLIFIMSEIGSIFVLANIVELISYGFLLGLIIKILENGKKTKPDGHHLRYVRNNSGKGWKH